MSDGAEKEYYFQRVDKKKAKAYAKAHRDKHGLTTVSVNGKVKERLRYKKGKRTYNDYLDYLMDLEDKLIAKQRAGN
jgi:hypothetical protein